MQFTTSIYVQLLLDFLLSVCIAIIYRTGERRFMWRSVSDLAIVRALCSVALAITSQIAIHRPSSAAYYAYFVTYYAFYFVLTGLAFRIFYDVYRKATVPFPGFARWAKPIFGWIVVVMISMTLMGLGTANAGTDFWARAGINMERAVQTVCVCVAALLLYLVQNMGLSVRSKVYGIMIGFMISNLGDVVMTIQYQFHLETIHALSLFVTDSSYICFAIWIGYAFVPEPLPQPVTVPAESPVYRWSQIASALGAKTSVAMPEPQQSFFLADVEQVVDKVFTRHMQESPESHG